ncbi:MAG: photosystem I reaction center subunit PsaK [Cyanothece sp. SIO1E1]|nr:photosystem I reaction center subunit PsaK [Cyanothece sp. SIO1E1]
MKTYDRNVTQLGLRHSLNQGEYKLTYLSLLALVPTTVAWSPKVGIVMALYNLLAIAIGKAVIKDPTHGPALPAGNFFGGFGLPAVLACWCLGHVLGLGGIIGLATVGIL